MKLPKYIREENNSRFGYKKEKEILKRTLRSGGFYFDPGDLKSDHYLIQVKSTQKKSYRITEEDLEQIFNQAYRVNKRPIFMVVFSKFTLVGEVRLR